MLADPIEEIIKDRLLAKDFSAETLGMILDSVFGPEGEHLPSRGAMPRKSTFGESDKGDRRVSLGYFTFGGLRGHLQQYCGVRVPQRLHQALHPGKVPGRPVDLDVHLVEQRDQDPWRLPQSTRDLQLPHLCREFLERRRSMAGTASWRTTEHRGDCLQGTRRRSTSRSHSSCKGDCCQVPW